MELAPGADGVVRHICIRCIVTSVFSLADGTLEKETLDSGKLDLGLVSAGSNGVQP